MAGKITPKEKQELETQLNDILEILVQDDTESLKNKRLKADTKVAIRNELFLQKFAKILADTPVVVKPATQTLKPVKKSFKSQRIVHWLVSDTHFGSLLKTPECPMKYGPVEEARRLAKCVKVLSEYKVDHRAETELHIHLLGDLIEGRLHDPEDGSGLLIEQCGAAIHLLSQAIIQLAGVFPTVKVNCVTGNHGRNKARHHDRAIAGKWDSIEGLIYEAVRQKVLALSKNIEFNVPKAGFYVTKIFGTKGFFSHGDTIVGLPNVGRTLNMSSITNSLNRISLEKHLLDGPPRITLFAVGHYHVPTCYFFSGGVIFINGALVPPNQYSVSNGGFYGTQGQWIWESTAEYVVGDQRLIVVDRDTDSEVTLDSIIQPYQDYLHWKY